MDSDVHSPLHPNCHYQVVCAKLNLKAEYPTLYEQLVWDYKNTNTQLLNRTIETFNWEKLLQNRKLMSSYISSTRPCLIFFKISFQIRM